MTATNTWTPRLVGEGSGHPDDVAPPTDGIETVRLLAEDGSTTSHPTYSPLLSPDAVRDAYRIMYLARRIDTEGTNLQRQGQLALWAPAMGQEAAQVGAISALRGDDRVYPSYRELSMAMHRGLDPVQIFQIMRGISHAGWDVDALNFGLFSFVVGAQTLQATGYAMGVTLDGADEVVLVCLGDGATRKAWSTSVQLRSGVQGAGLPGSEQPVRDLRTQLPAVPRVAGRAGHRLRDARHPCRRQRPAGGQRGGRRGGRARPPRRGADAGRGDDLSAGRAHHRRRPDPLPESRGGGVVGRARPSDPYRALAPRPGHAGHFATSPPRATRSPPMYGPASPWACQDHRPVRACSPGTARARRGTRQVTAYLASWRAADGAG